MPYAANTDLPQMIQDTLPAEAQSVWRTIFNAASKQYKAESRIIATAWAGLKTAGWDKDEKGNWTKVEKSFLLNVPITKIDLDKRQVFGWANVSQDWVLNPDGTTVLKQIVDHQEDLVDPDDLELMAYRFTKMYRDGGVMHIQKQSAIMIESMVFTIEKQQALHIPAGVVPVGWWIGFEVSDNTAWEGVKNGTYKAFSIEGTAQRENVE